ncbi:hypothetical protein Q31a_04610 [Aureliella helgolandensis]|uniref:Uncharacterized protein n=1 Tax=Aureliella helgolandensis TaxID=2527968 RepID=A0A518G0P8_9BACT|nr:hypothetical protein Q31a_04610 [Aureliella helgolandensis]
METQRVDGCVPRMKFGKAIESKFAGSLDHARSPTLHRKCRPEVWEGNHTLDAPSS